MSNNEIMLRGSKQSGIVAPDFTQGTNVEDLRRFKLNVTKGRKKDGSTFNKVYTFVIMDTYTKDNRYVGKQVHKVEMHFKKTAFKGASNVHSPEDLSSGYLFVRVEGCKVPTVYRIGQKKDKDGNVLKDEKGNIIPKFPEVWIESDILGLEPFKVTQDALDVDNYNSPIEVAKDEDPIADEDGVILEDVSNDETIEDLDEAQAVSDIANEPLE